MPAMFGDVDLWLPSRIRSFLNRLRLGFQTLVAKISAKFERKHSIV